MESNPLPQITKSAYIQGLQCPKRYYLNAFKPELRASLEQASRTVFRSGSDVVKAARELFPGGVFGVNPDEPDFSWEKAATDTRQCMDTSDILYQAAFEHNGLCCIIDMLVKRNGRWYAYEVKAVNRLQQKHYDDITFQYYVLQQCGIDVADLFLVHMNPAYVRIGPIDAGQLFHRHSVIRQARKSIHHLEMVLQQLRSLSAEQPEPAIDTGNHCKQPYPCPYISYCNPNSISVEPSPSAEPEIQTKQVSAFLEKLIYPLYFFDFEAVQYAVPEFDHSSPFQQIPFQYSLHIQAFPGGELQHTYYLGDGVLDPRHAIMQKLLTDLGQTGSIITWNKTFEATCIRDLAVDFPLFTEPLHALLQRMEDLMLPFSKHWIRLPAAQGKSSLKTILPLLCPELTYASLDIQEGTMASYTYSRLHQQDEETRKINREQLLAYCQMDTFAMVKILEKIMEWNNA